ncbi:glycoside hydrolase superfamily [Aspergillus pseudotamarii]|uniref:Probable beta-glucosidase btgE n=1 Tax=Aspergillus pseudotamarii TaxID=132259 RepID=A0A5N6T2K1_ASPPS|nr:glycoside hydrolase superfamily [Aspergillus pseudotamarii]KAE8140528.1 glycoside hydrolase superfamily [Aspergillus pseudotamarii]
MFLNWKTFTLALATYMCSFVATSAKGTNSGLSGAGLYGISFTPYTSSGTCMSQDEVTKSLQRIKKMGFDLVRVYSTDCNSLERIGSACKELDINVILGVFIGSSGTSGAQEQVQAISHWAQWPMVKLIVVGNEAIQSGCTSASKLSSFISSARRTFRAAGYSGNVTTSEPLAIWKKHGVSTLLCSQVDIVGANVHPFFNAKFTPAQAGVFARYEYSELARICKKPVLILETGWPNAGDANGLAVPGVAEQKTAITAIAKNMGPKSVFFSYSDDPWKPPGEFNEGQHWGCRSVFSSRRPSLMELVGSTLFNLYKRIQGVYPFANL